MAETAGIPSVALVCEGFLSVVPATSSGLGFPAMPVALVPGHPGVQSDVELRRNIRDVTLDRVVAGLTGPVDGAADEHDDVAPRDIVFAGSFDQVNEFFYRNEWSDGLPIVPPTVERVEAFLRATRRRPDEVLGVPLPDRRTATVWSVAVNGVMAGCLPEYMPVLVALVEAMCDPAYGVEHSGNTPGAETLIILNGPVIERLEFNCGQGVLRDGYRANTSVGRFWRLYLRNVAGFLPNRNDKATFGNTWRVVMPENEAVLQRIGWPNIAAEQGFAAEDSTVTVMRLTGGDVIASVAGDTPESMLPYIVDAVVKQQRWQLNFTVFFEGSLRPLLLLSPILAETIARAGWSKGDLRRYLFDHARLPAWELLRYLQYFGDSPQFDFEKSVRRGKLPPVFHESSDPNRLVPIVFEPKDFMIAVTGDPARTNAYVFSHNGSMGFPTSRRIEAL